ncbi:uncharacterized protein LOC124461285 [Drosophila willistoni]|uniref:uncharacterized protein LOC124461285 n=1 Tax=Drosophila willistoni TaxID=7260 RepID=UPI001F076D1C|nr:uncharacterized protein LOC124461285 [Drosophila willistoni]
MVKLFYRNLTSTLLEPTPRNGVLRWIGSGECLAVCGSRLMTSLLTKWRGMDHEQIAASVVLGHLANYDSRLQRIAYTLTIRSRRDLQSELQVFSFDNKRSSSSDDYSTLPIKCYSCGKLGHRKSECRGQKPSTSGEDQRASSVRAKVVTCYRCHEPGHISTQCSKSSDGDAGSRVHKRVNLCVVDEPKAIVLRPATRNTTGRHNLTP